MVTPLTKRIGWLKRSNATISTEVSQVVSLARVFLLLQVVFGHIAAIALPKMADAASYDIAYTIMIFFFRLTTRFGAQSAYVFVFLSGFLVGGPLLTAVLADGSSSWGAFFGRRASRIVPILWVALCLTAIMDSLGIYVFGARNLYETSGAYNFYSALSLPNFIANIFCLEPTLSSVFGSNGPLWTLGYIVQFYWIGFLLLRAPPTRNMGGVAAASLVIIVCSFLRTEWLPLFSIWCLGAVVRNYESRSRSNTSIPLWVCVLVFILANRFDLVSSILASGLAGTFLIAWARRREAAGPWSGAGLIYWLDKRGYEIFAVHYPILFFIFCAWFQSRTTTMFGFSAFLIAGLLSVLLATEVSRSAASRVSLAISQGG